MSDNVQTRPRYRFNLLKPHGLEVEVLCKLRVAHQSNPAVDSLRDGAILPLSLSNLLLQLWLLSLVDRRTASILDYFWLRLSQETDVWFWDDLVVASRLVRFAAENVSDPYRHAIFWTFGCQPERLIHDLAARRQAWLALGPTLAEEERILAVHGVPGEPATGLSLHGGTSPSETHGQSTSLPPKKNAQSERPISKRGAA